MEAVGREPRTLLGSERLHSQAEGERSGEGVDYGLECAEVVPKDTKDT